MNYIFITYKMTNDAAFTLQTSIMRIRSPVVPSRLRFLIFITQSIRIFLCFYCYIPRCLSMLKRIYTYISCYRRCGYLIGQTWLFAIYYKTEHERIQTTGFISLDDIIIIIFCLVSSTVLNKGVTITIYRATLLCENEIISEARRSFLLLSHKITK